MDKEIILKKAVDDNKDQLVSTSDLINMAMQFQQLFMMYESAIKQVKTQFEILEDEFTSKHERKPISSISSRIKEPMSIAEKLQRKGLPITIDNMVTKLFDIAGIRITCPFISDVYRVLHILETLDDIEIIEQKDYIKEPKKSGYRSLHVVVKVRVSFSDQKREIPVEIQIRTIAMDFWASLEHQIHYKKDYSMPDNIVDELKSIAETIHDTDKRMQNLAEYLPDFVDYSKEYK
ncbi:MAG: GTP pyrophosphokinase family protein [Treponema sp.]|nr:GTP pyrophosphokinase family protein [Treponema sp.]